MTKKALILSLAVFVSPCGAASWFEEMQFGPAWSNTFSHNFQGKSRVAAYKGILVDLGGRKHSAMFDTETLRWVSGYAGFVNWGGTPWTGAHGKLVTLNDQTPIFVTDATSGYADASGSFVDKRPLKGFGNLPSDHGRYVGYYKNGGRIVFASEVLGAKVLEAATADLAGPELFAITRHWEIGARSKDLLILLADESGEMEVSADGKSAKSASGLFAELSSSASTLSLAAADGRKNRLVLRVPAGKDLVKFQVVLARGQKPTTAEPLTLSDLTKGGSPQYTETLTSSGTTGKPDEGSSWAVDQISLPASNPWKSNLRFGGFDFLDENTAVLSTWNGDVWTVSGFQQDMGKLTWRRIASGLFETLGVKVVNGAIYVNGRDQITRLHDLNKDGEIDYFEAFNRDVLISSNFHEFAFDLQTDAQGNFYFCKGSPVKGGGRGFDQILPHHGIVAKISPDGKKFEVIASGLRAPGGLGVGPEGQITTGENEGTWQPCCKLNYFTPSQAPVFLGTEPSRHEIGKDKPFHEPLCYLPMSVDNSGGSQVWVPQDTDFGLKAGELIHLSYGQSTLYRVLPAAVGDALQGGVVKIPAKLQSSAMRARFHKDGSLYVLGFRGWQTNAPSECAFQRVRFVKDQAVLIPSAQKITAKGVILTFDQQLDDELATDPGSFAIERWNYVRGPQYGSGEFSVDNPDTEALENALKSESKNVRVHDKVEVLSAKLSPDKKSVELELKDMKPCMTLKIGYDLESTKGSVMIGTVYSTIRKLP
ncbi:MAG: hypothetical protein RI957_1140 [Verrucomicrobiota bacterium]